MKIKKTVSAHHRLLFAAWIILIGFILSGCIGASEMDQINSPNVDAHKISLAAAGEPGQRLTIYGTVVDQLTNEPITNAHVYLYHADANGEYLPSDPNDESTAKLSGEVVSGDSGQFTVHTIVPREYDQSGDRHIHLHYVRADGYEEIGRVILFEHDVNDEVRQWAIETGFGIIIELVERVGVMVGDVTIRLVPHSE